MELSLRAIGVILLLARVSQGRINTRDNGTFENPASRDRPRFRYWLPDASIDPEVLKSDIEAVGSIGGGGVEFLPFYNYGGSLGGPPPGVDWAKYGFGTPAYIEVLKAALEAHDKAGLAMDIAMGPNQGQGVPASPQDEGLQWDLIPLSQEVPQNGKVNTILPGWGTGKLIAAVSAFVLSSENKTIVASGVQGPKNVTYEQLVLRNSTVEDVTSKVSPETGILNAVFPRPCGERRFRVFAFYDKLSGHKNLAFSSNSSNTLWDNGSFAVDHFSGRGAQVTTRFWEDYILKDEEVKTRLRKVGNFGWEDSLELMSTISWSPTLPERFAKMFGYDLKPYLPLIVFANNNINIQGDAPGPFEAFLDTKDAGAGIINDYRAALAQGYVEYLQTLRDWLHETLGLSLSVQPAYNMPMDMLSVIPFIDAPESESLQGQNNVDGYRSFAGPANLASNKVISNELGAVFGRGFSLTTSELLQMANRGFAGGLNQFVIHGQSYSGDYPGTTWPGHVPFRYYVSDLYSPKRPDWEHGLGQALDYLARIQHVQRQGVARTDVAVYQKKSVTDPDFNTYYEGKDLVTNGWSFNYLTAANFDLEQAAVHDAILAPGGPAYRALVIPSSANFTLGALHRLQEYAKNGLPIILPDAETGTYPTGTSEDDQIILDGIASLRTSKNVYTASEGQVSDLISSLGIRPRVGVQINGTWYTTWREDAETGVDYAYIFSDLVAASGEVIADSTKTPYVLDAWTGRQSPLLYYKVEDGKTRFPLTLAGNQTMIIAFSDQGLPGSESAPDVWFHEVPSGVISVGKDGKGLYANVPATGPASGLAKLSSGKATQLESSAPEAFELSNWTLTAEHWEAPSDLFQVSVNAQKRNTTHELPKLVSWLDIPQLVNTSGIGYYNTQFSWSKASRGRFGAFIKFPAAKNGLLLRVNDQNVGPLDHTDPGMDITEYLLDGINQVTAIVPTTMWNYIRSILPSLKNGGMAPIPGSTGPAPDPTDNGLMGEVHIVPYERIYMA